MTESLIYRAATASEIIEVRCSVLRPQHVEMDLRFAGDDLSPPHAWHFGTFTHDRKNIACLTLFEAPWEKEPALQLRGMAVAAEFRGTGIGTRLLQAAQGTVAAHAEASQLLWWCNARVAAIPFYQGNGWRVMSDEFNIPDVGPHRKMLRGPAQG